MKRTFFKPNHKNHKRKDNNMDANEKKINSEEELMNENTPETEAAEQPQEEEKAQ